MCYVDDPLAGVYGSLAERRLYITMMVLVWRALDFKLAFPKGQTGHKVTWIGGTLEIHSNNFRITGITATVQESIVADIVVDLDAFLRLNIITKKAIHSLIGKLSHAAGLLILLRPFLDPLWTAWAADDLPGMRGRIWKRQIQTELRWCRAFFLGEGPIVQRFFSVASYTRSGTRVEIGTDASPWGLGGYLSVNNTVVRYFASAISEDDCSKYKFVIGDTKGQQLWEALAVLVAIDLWGSKCLLERVLLSVKSDNVAALTLLTKMRPSSSHDEHGNKVPNTTMAVVARELAMRLVHMSFPPDAVHTPGVGHLIADRLSRVFSHTSDQGELRHLHPALLHAIEDEAPPRTKDWYRTS